MPLLPIKLKFWGKMIWGSWRIWMKNDLREQSWFDSTMKKSFIGQSISSKLSGQFLPWLKNNFMKFWGCGMPNFTAMPIFQQICLGMQEAHTGFYQCSASTASRLFKIFFQTDSQFKNINFQPISIQKVCIINNRTWIWRSDNLRSMEHLDEK